MLLEWFDIECGLMKWEEMKFVVEIIEYMCNFLLKVVKSVLGLYGVRLFV